MDLTTEEPSLLVKPKTTEDFSLISRASEAFKNADYDQCLETLGELEAVSYNSSNIGKVRHNRAICEYYKSNCKDHPSLLKSLKVLDSDEVVRTSPIACYNKAVIYYHRHMHRTAIETLTPLVDRLDSLEEPTGSLVGILMLRLLLATNQLNKANNFLEQLQLNMHFEALTLDEGCSLKEEGLQQSFKLLATLTNIQNRKAVVITDDGSVESAALKAHQYYIMKDFQMAAKQLEKISNDNYKTGLMNDELNTCIANNMGVIHLRVRHYAIAAKFFQNAIAFDKQISANLRTASLQHMSAARSCEILYNLGISMLHLRRPKEAFQCFLVPLKSYHSNPRLWFRISEACIMDHEMKLLEDDKKLAFSGMPTKPTTRTIYSARNQSAAVPEANLDFAALSLRNALTLTAFYRSNFYKPNDEEGATCDTQNWNNAKDNNFCNPSKPISKAALDNMMLAIYAAYSYVSLRLGDYVQALEMAQELLKAENVSDAHKMLAHMYAGEALIMMDKLAEARPHLEPTFVSSLNAFDFETKDWQVKSLDAAQNIVRYNLAVAMVLQGDFDMASSLVSTCTHPIVNSKATSLKLYLDMRMGKPHNTALF